MRSLYFTFVGISDYNAFFRIVSHFSMRTNCIEFIHANLGKLIKHFNISNAILMYFLEFYRYRNFNAFLRIVSHFPCARSVFWPFQVKKSHKTMYKKFLSRFNMRFMFSIVYAYAFKKTHYILRYIFITHRLRAQIRIGVFNAFFAHANGKYRIFLCEIRNIF